MKITIEKNADNVKLLKQMADKNLVKAMEAREAFAAFITQPILEVIESAPVIQALFSSSTYDYGTPSTIPLAQLWDIKTNDFIKVWTQSRPGGLATSQNSSVDELTVMTYPLTSAVAFPLNYVRAARVEVVAQFLQRMAQEFLYKQEVNSFAILGASVTQGTYTNRVTGANTTQIIRSNTQGVVVPQDISALITLMARINSSWVGGTPSGATRAITTLVGSPEFMGVIRNMAFEPLNTTLRTVYPLGGPDKFRQDIYDSAGGVSIYGMELISVFDMGQGYPYNIVAGSYAGSTTYPGFGGAAAAVFSPGSEQLVIGVDRRRDYLVRLVESNPDDNSTLTVQTDNQWSNRAEEIGFWSRIREGRVAIDSRNVCALLY